MPTLAGCPSCSRHVRIDEPSCPFCGHALAGAFDERPAPMTAVGRFSRAALFALGTTAAAAGTTLLACSDDGGQLPAYGMPVQPEDDGGNDAGTPATLYGAPAVTPDGGNN